MNSESLEVIKIENFNVEIFLIWWTIGDSATAKKFILETCKIQLTMTNFCSVRTFISSLLAEEYLYLGNDKFSIDISCASVPGLFCYSFSSSLYPFSSLCLPVFSLSSNRTKNKEVKKNGYRSALVGPVSQKIAVFISNSYYLVFSPI